MGEEISDARRTYDKPQNVCEDGRDNRMSVDVNVKGIDFISFHRQQSCKCLRIESVASLEHTKID